jgi:hypothetical protein
MSRWDHNDDGTFTSASNPALASGHIFVGSSQGVAADVALSGDATMANTGAITVGAAAITNSKLAVPKVTAIVSQALAVAAFTDNANTTGYIDITTQIPAGSIVLGWKAVVSGGFTGDTTATIQVGVSGTLDKYSAVTTNSVFAAGTVGCAPCKSATNVFEAAAVTARVTVTGTADFTSIVTSASGAMVVTIYVLQTV